MARIESLYKLRQAYKRTTIVVQWIRTDGSMGARTFAGTTPHEALRKATNAIKSRKDGRKKILRTKEELLEIRRRAARRRGIPERVRLPWSDEIDAFIKENYRVMATGHIAEYLTKNYLADFTKNAVISRYNKRIKHDVPHSE